MGFVLHLAIVGATSASGGGGGSGAAGAGGGGGGGIGVGAGCFPASHAASASTMPTSFVTR